MKIKPEQTAVQTPAPWSLTGAAGYFSNLYKALRGSSSPDRPNRYEPETGTGGAEGFGASIVSGGDLSTAMANAIVPLALPRYRVMARQSTIALAEAACVLPILAAETNVVIDEDLAEDPVALRGKQILEQEIIKRRATIFRAALQSIRYGWKDLEVVYVRKSKKSIGDYVGVKKFKELAGDHIQLRVDTNGNLTQVLSYGKPLDPDYFLHFVHGKEDDNWFGLSRLENIRRDWANYLDGEDDLGTLIHKGAAKAPYVGVMPEDPLRADKDSTPNKDMGMKIARALSNGQPVVYEKSRGIDNLDMRVNAELAEKNLVSVEFLDIGNPGPAIQSISSRLDTLAKNMIRGMLLPERTLTEAASAGSRADSESHGDLAVTAAESLHELLIEQLNEQTVAALIRENCGEEYVDAVRLQAVQLQDERREQLSAFFNQLLTDKAFLHSLIKAIAQGGGVETLVSKLGLDVKLKGFELEEEQPPAQVGKPTKEAGDANLAAIDELDDLQALSGDWDAAKHPRAADGRFAVVNTPMFNGDGKAAKKWALAYVRGEFVNDATGKTINVGRGGIEKATSHTAKLKSGSDDHFEALQVLPELIKDATLIESRPDRDNNEEIRAIHRFASKVQIGDRMHDVKLTVKEHAQPSQGHRFYTHELTEIELPRG